MDAVTLRFEEFQRYDITLDCEVVTLMGITNMGTYTGTVQVLENEPGKLRAHRRMFQEGVLKAIEEGVPPHDIYWDFSDDAEEETDE